MKKTIAAIALIASSNALALPAPRDPNAPAPKVVKVCMSVYADRDGAKYGGCDESSNNASAKVKLASNGCTTNQIALQFLDKSPIEACMPPGVAQL